MSGVEKRQVAMAIGHQRGKSWYNQLHYELRCSLPWVYKWYKKLIKNHGFVQEFDNISKTYWSIYRSSLYFYRSLLQTLDDFKRHDLRPRVNKNPIKTNVVICFYSSEKWSHAPEVGFLCGRLARQKIKKKLNSLISSSQLLALPQLLCGYDHRLFIYSRTICLPTDSPVVGWSRVERSVCNVFGGNGCCTASKLWGCGCG